MQSRITIFISIIILSLLSCQNDGSVIKTNGPRFVLKKSNHTKVEFNNKLTYDNDFNIYTYRNFYNGGGVAIGDVNKDGLMDLYFTGNQVSNKLYLNNGDFTFEDITESAGVPGNRSWSTGVCMADVNGDTHMDIYVCNSGDVEGDNKQNELFINNGDNTFTESAEEYGLADQGYSTHAAFFDFDKDGDLDMYLLNNSYQATESFNLKKEQRPIRDESGDKFFKNNNGKFEDVSEEVGIYGSIIGFGMGVTVGDINNDSWQDIYVSNDFFERDYLYLNNGDGTFSEKLEEQMRSITGGSMGADMADINNDGQLDIFVTEMLPEKEERIKTSTTFESWGRYNMKFENGYYHQFARNMLHLNNGDETFSEIGRMADVEATDWSWGSLMADYDNDGLKDLFIANGIYQDLTNQDYINFIANEKIANKEIDYQQLIDAMPSNPVPNYLFRNSGDLEFENITASAGLDFPGFSNGSAYGDLDNDGDLDLVVNNVNMPSFIYENTSLGNNYIKLNLQGKGKNTDAVGARVTVYADGMEMMLEQMPIRGFQSSVDPRLNFGVGEVDMIDSIVINWPDSRLTKFKDVEVNQMLVIDEKTSVTGFVKTGVPRITPMFEEIAPINVIDHLHKENEYVDFNRDRLLFHMFSTEGPRLAKADINRDDLEDLYIGGANGELGQMYLQEANGSFRPIAQVEFLKDLKCEDTDAVFFDADNDGDQDLYVCSGGSEFYESSKALRDRLYLNNGNAIFEKSPHPLPFEEFESTSTVQVADYNGDGFQDLFVGVRFKPTRYGVPCNGYILENDGTGKFTNVTKDIAKELLEFGMITDAIWSDIDDDDDPDLIVVGDWSPIAVFKNNNGKFSRKNIYNSTGWWNSIESGDFNNDGKIDFVLGNHGTNSRFKANEERPITMLTNDFDNNGTAEQIISCFNGKKSYPMALRQDIVGQIPKLKKKYGRHENYVDQTVQDIFSAEELENSVHNEVMNLSSTIMINKGNGSFYLKELPINAQYAPVFGLLVEDFDQDGNQDILLGGNLHKTKPEVGRYDASYGLYLKGHGNATFTPIDSKTSGIQLSGEVRDIQQINTVNGKVLLVVKNDDHVQSFTYYQ